MRRRVSIFLPSFFATVAMLSLAGSASGQTATTLLTFTEKNGSYPSGPLTLDTAGNLYGTTGSGGEKRNNGEVYELSPAADGTWTQTILYSFAGGNDGKAPIAGVTFDASGNLFGTTYFGGQYDAGTVFEISPATGGGWTEKVLYSFLPHHHDAVTPFSPVVFDKAGNLYGAASGGANDEGAVFELSPMANGRWKEKVIFSGSDTDGLYFQNLAMDNDGHLYVEADNGGALGGGAIYRLTNTTDGWHPEAIYNFVIDGIDGCFPGGGLTVQPPDRLLGVADGGTSFQGIVFELTPRGSGLWNETILFNFGDFPAGPLNSNLAITLGASGQLYGASAAGGNLHVGAAFELAYVAGAWQEKPLYNYTGGSYPESPSGSLIVDSAGNLYGVESGTNPPAYGAVYEITP